MNAVIGMSRILLDSKLNPELAECAETIESSGNQLMTVIDDILDFSKIESGNLKLENRLLDLSFVVESAVNLIDSQAIAKNLSLVYEIDRRCPVEIMGDVTRIRQILLNLMSNAVKFTKEGTIHVSVTMESPEVKFEDEQEIKVDSTKLMPSNSLKKRQIDTSLPSRSGSQLASTATSPPSPRNTTTDSSTTSKPVITETRNKADTPLTESVGIGRSNSGSLAPPPTKPVRLLFAVKDTGVGIPSNRFDKLFTSFSQVDESTTREYGGTGLGLAISKRLSEMMGGSMWVRSTPNVGSTFYFNIVLNSPVGCSTYEEQFELSKLAEKKLVIVDDSEMGREAWKRRAESWNMGQVKILQSDQILHYLQEDSDAAHKRIHNKMEALIIDTDLNDSTCNQPEGLLDIIRTASAKCPENAMEVKEDRPLIPVIIFKNIRDVKTAASVTTPYHGHARRDASRWSGERISNSDTGEDTALMHRSRMSSPQRRPQPYGMIYDHNSDSSTSSLTLDRTATQTSEKLDPRPMFAAGQLLTPHTQATTYEQSISSIDHFSTGVSSPAPSLNRTSYFSSSDNESAASPMHEKVIAYGFRKPKGLFAPPVYFTKPIRHSKVLQALVEDYVDVGLEVEELLPVNDSPLALNRFFSNSIRTMPAPISLHPPVPMRGTREIANTRDPMDTPPLDSNAPVTKPDAMPTTATSAVAGLPESLLPQALPSKDGDMPEPRATRSRAASSGSGADVKIHDQQPQPEPRTRANETMETPVTKRLPLGKGVRSGTPKRRLAGSAAGTLNSAAGYASPSMAAAAAASSSTARKMAKVKVLVVDDNPVNLKVVSKMLARLGVEPDMANNGQEAVELIEKKMATLRLEEDTPVHPLSNGGHQSDSSNGQDSAIGMVPKDEGALAAAPMNGTEPGSNKGHMVPYDLIFLDVWMPKMNGLDASAYIREHLSGGTGDRPYIIAMTACVMPGDREKCIAAGMNDYISKPLRKEELEQCLRVFTSQHSKLVTA
jgi:signal transduction histidine kinase/CheY-like chemotaxis protein